MTLQSERGVTLIEALLALTILTFGMAVLLRLVGENLLTVARTGDAIRAEALAEEALAFPFAVGTVPAAGSGREGHYRWQREVRLTEVTPSGSMTPVEVAEVVVTVRWGEQEAQLQRRRLVAVPAEGF